MDVFEITGRGINSTLRDVQISYAWTFGNLTDVLISEHMLTPLEDMSVGFVTLLLSSGVQCLQVPTKVPDLTWDFDFSLVNWHYANG